MHSLPARFEGVLVAHINRLRTIVLEVVQGTVAHIDGHVALPYRGVGADQQQFYDLAGVLGRGERQTTIVNPQVRPSAVVVKYSVSESDAGVVRRPLLHGENNMTRKETGIKVNYDMWSSTCSPRPALVLRQKT
jgi:hypothetical protein